MDNNISFDIAFVILGIVIGLTIAAVFMDSNIKELAQSICDQEYNMDFKSYEDKQLECKPRVIDYREQYDGIVVKIMEE